MTAGIIVKVSHARAAKLGGRGFLCSEGIRGWCRRYDVDLVEFCNHGLPIERIEAIPDAFAQRVAAIARAEAISAGEVIHG